MVIRDQERFRRHKGACIFYRENWMTGPERRNADGEIVLYEIHCLRGWPPETQDEQHTCMLSATRCWRDQVLHSTVLAREAEENAAKVS